MREEQTQKTKLRDVVADVGRQQWRFGFGYGIAAGMAISGVAIMVVVLLFGLQLCR